MIEMIFYAALIAVVYLLIGLHLLEQTGILDSQAFNKKVNPVQDYIGWLPAALQLLFWLPLLVVWHASRLFKPNSWKTFVRHTDLMDMEAERTHFDSDEYAHQSPRNYRKYGFRPYT
jgi:hypothetical protein